MHIAIYMLIAVIAGYWWGEHSRAILPLWDFISLITLIILANWPWQKAKALQIIIVTFCLIFTFAFCWKMGANNQHNTFNDCVQNGEQIREKLQAFYTQNKRYPASLSELTLDSPCMLVFPPQLLYYQLTPSGYNLEFGDFVTHSATESAPFEAHK